ncbi:MAG: GNAT family N-acetyltransferase [Armatimonadetes bacterium]|nr:GNAT family N-acetyltransferase [Armatimonadota bacterium]
MHVRIVSVTDSNLPYLPGSCGACAYWESPDRFSGQFTQEETGLKRDWYSSTARLYGACGRLLYADDEPVAYCQYAPWRLIPGISRYPSLARGLDEDAVMITCLYVAEMHQRKGLGRMLLSDLVEELRARKAKCLDTFARDDSANNCSGPTSFYLAQGFGVVSTERFPDGSSFSLVRLCLDG